MPRGDATGPEGKGSLTGRGMGGCKPTKKVTKKVTKKPRSSKRRK